MVYELQATALCPKEPFPRNVYQVRVEAERQIWTEDLEAWAAAVEDRAIFQEDLTRELAVMFPGTTVEVAGVHGRVRVTSSDRVEVAG